jgi:hypothetical protein
MITQIRRVAVLLVLFAVGLAAPGYAVAEPQAVLYELSENMNLIQKRDASHRVAISSLMGYANIDTPLCPRVLVQAVSPNATFCTVTAFGGDNISLTSGTGLFGGYFTVVVQGDNPVDSPELVVARGTFSGQMDFSPAILHMIPLGSVTGNLYVIGSSTAVPFTGKFRLPFVVPVVPEADLGACLAGPNPASCFSPAMYLKDDWDTVAVREDEKALGYPTVKFEISF